MMMCAKILSAKHKETTANLLYFILSLICFYAFQLEKSDLPTLSMPNHTLFSASLCRFLKKKKRIQMKGNLTFLPVK